MSENKPGETFLDALKQARAQEHARLDAVMQLRDLRALRLMELHDALRAQLSGTSATEGLFDLNVDAGDTPRLWLDLESSIVMAPDPKTYRLVQAGQGRIEVVYETADAAAMEKFAVRHMARQAVAGRRPGSPQPGWRGGPFTGREVVLAGLLGLALGLLLAAAWALHSGLPTPR